MRKKPKTKNKKPKRKIIISKSAEETKKIGKNLAKKILASKIAEKAVIIALEGNLGSGKTTFLQGLAKGLRIKDKILSPTFIIFKKFPIPNSSVSKNRRPSIFRDRDFYHIDCYRIKNQSEILELGFKKIISEPKNIVAIEWPEKIKKIIPKNVKK